MCILSVCIAYVAICESAGSGGVTNNWKCICDVH